jgi:cell wall-associated NlpC family hydrolase
LIYDTLQQGVFPLKEENMNNSKIKKLLAVGILSFMLSGYPTPVAQADKVPQQIIKEKGFDFRSQLINHAKYTKNTERMKETVIKLMRRVNKTSYVFSGSTPYGWDCSGMVKWTYKQFGLDLPHSANKQAHIGKRVSVPKLGDIVVFAYRGSTNFYHSGIYIGKGKIVNAHYEAGTTIIQPLTDYKNSQIRFVRVVSTL